MLALPILLALACASGNAAATPGGGGLLEGHPNVESSRTILAMLRRRSSVGCCQDWAQACCVACSLGFSYDTWCAASPMFGGCPKNPNPPGVGPTCSERPTATPTRVPTTVPTPVPTSCEHHEDTLPIVHDLANTTQHTVEEVFDLVARTDLRLQSSGLMNNLEATEAGVVSIDGAVAIAEAGFANMTSDSSAAKTDAAAMKTEIAAMKADMASIASYLSSTVTLLASVKAIAQQYYDEKLYNPFASSSILGDKAELGIWLHDKIPKKSMSLCWRGTTHGFSASTFHSNCDNRGATVTIVEDSFGGIFGGYTGSSWNGNVGSISDSTAFLYQLRGANNDGDDKWPAWVPVKYTSSSYYQYAIYSYSNHGPIFGSNHDLLIYSNCNTNYNSYNHPTGSTAYPDFAGIGYFGMAGVNTWSENNFFCRDVEVWLLS